jgi:hypothetical protein
VTGPDPAAYFVRVAPHRFLPTRHTSGAWSETEQHVSPLAGLVVHEIERHAAAASGDDGKVISRVTFDILGVVAIEELEIEVTTLRPGRTVELVEAVVTSGPRTVLRARAWRLATTDTSSVAGGAAPPIPFALPAWPMTSVWPGGYIASLDVRRHPDSSAGRAVVWVDTSVTLVEAEQVSTLARYVGLVDTANGIGVRESPDEWLFPNLDLSVHLHRQPGEGPVGLDTTVVFGPDGRGLTSSILHDGSGPVGLATQILTVRPR